MSSVVTLLFTALWAVIGFALLRYVLNRLFRDTRHATIAALLAVAAYVAGYYSPLASHTESASGGAQTGPAGAPPIGAVAPPAPEAAAGGKDASGACAGVDAPTGKGLGYADTFEDAGTPSVALASGASVAAGHVLVMSGWAASATGDAPASAVCLSLDGKVDAHATVRYGISRPDVASNMHEPSLDRTGFTISIRTTSLAKGSHAFAAVAESKDGSTGPLRGGWTIEIR